MKQLIELKDKKTPSLVLIKGRKSSQDLNTLVKQLNLTSRGRLHEYVQELELAGFISRDYTWQLKQKKLSKLSRFRLKDNYLRFYLRYIEPRIKQINRGLFAPTSLEDLPGWQSMMGLQIENIVLNNRPLIWQHLNITGNDILYDNPYFQQPTQRQAGTQIDYLIQIKQHSLYLCEIKFSKYPIAPTIIKALQQKIQALNIPHGYSIRPVLIHVNGVSESVQECDFFSHFIDLGQL